MIYIIKNLLYETKKYIVLKTLEIRNIHFFNKTIQNIRNYNYLKNILKKIFDEQILIY